MSEAVAQILEWIERRDGVCRFVVTPNADHAVLYQENEKLRKAYAAASLILVDGMPLLLAAKILRRGVPERVPGSDLVPALFASVSEVHHSPLTPVRLSSPKSGPSPADSTSSRQVRGEGRNCTRHLRVFLLAQGPAWPNGPPSKFMRRGAVSRSSAAIVRRWASRKTPPRTRRF